MRASLWWRVVVLSGVALSAFAGAAGCAAMPPEVSALMKIGTGQINELNGTEIQAATVVLGVQIELTDEQADAIADFLELNNLRTIADVQALIEQALADPCSIQLPDGFLELFADIDPSSLEPFLPG